MVLKSKLFLSILLLSTFSLINGQNLQSFELTLEWKKKIESLVRDQKDTNQKEEKIVDFFSPHWVSALVYSSYRGSNENHCTKFRRF